MKLSLKALDSTASTTEKEAKSQLVAERTRPLLPSDTSGLAKVERLDVTSAFFQACSLSSVRKQNSFSTGQGLR